MHAYQRTEAASHKAALFSEQPGTSLCALPHAPYQSHRFCPPPPPPCRSRYLLQPTALECFMADRASHALFNFPSQQASFQLWFKGAVARLVFCGDSAAVCISCCGRHSPVATIEWDCACVTELM